MTFPNPAWTIYLSIEQDDDRALAIAVLIVGPVKEEDAMRKWSRPAVVEISVGMEINCYACAEI